MDESLENLIMMYKKGVLKTRRLQIITKNLSDEIIANEFLGSSTFKDSKLFQIKFTEVDLGLSFFYNCLFKNCIFEFTSLRDASFFNCSFINCQIQNCYLKEVDFTETIFDTCCFERVEKGTLLKGWFETCHFINTDFKGFEGIPLLQTALVDSKFSKFNKSIEFKGEFFLSDILHPTNGIDGMFIE